MDRHLKRKAAFSLTEVLIVLAIMAVLAGITASFIPQLKKGRDAKRKNDLHNIKTALEDYFNDKGCYPVDVSMFTDESKCGSTADYPLGFAPWLKKVPCDPRGKPYYLTIEGDPSCPSRYLLFTEIEYVSDPQLAGNTCSGGCSMGSFYYNYVVASTGISLIPPNPTCSYTLLSCFKRNATLQTCNGPLVSGCTGGNCFAAVYPGCGDSCCAGEELECCLHVDSFYQ